jgi:hypothetical protein
MLLGLMLVSMALISESVVTAPLLGAKPTSNPAMTSTRTLLSSGRFIENLLREQQSGKMKLRMSEAQACCLGSTSYWGLVGFSLTKTSEDNEGAAGNEQSGGCLMA